MTPLRASGLTALAALAAIGLPALTACSTADSADAIGTTSVAPPTGGVTSTSAPPLDVAALAPMPGGPVECVRFSESLQSLSLAAAAIAPADQAADLASFRPDLPAELQGDLDLVVSRLRALSQSAQGDLSRGKEMSAPDLAAATDRLTSYLSTACTG